MKKIIKALIKRPGEPAEMALIENELKAFQKIVGGYIETVTIIAEEPKVVIICNEEGRILNMPYNCTINGIDFCGDIIAVGVDGDEFADLPEAVTRKVWNDEFLEMINGRLAV